MSKSLSKSRFVEMFGNIKETIPLENCCSLISDFVASGSFASLRDNVKYYDKENYAVLVRTIDFANNFSKDLVYTDKHGYDFLSKTNLYGGEILLSNIGASIGKVFRVPYLNKPMTLAPNSIVIKPNDNYTNEFLEYFFSIGRGQDELHVMTTATATPKFNKTQLRQVPVPKVSKEIQNDFSCFVKQLDKSKFILQKMIEKLELLKKSRFIELFGNPTINEKGFPLLTVDDVIKFEGGSQPNKAFFEYEKTENNIRLIQIRDYKTDEYITYIPKDMAKRLCSADDIMIGRYGPPIFQILQGIEGAYNVALMKAIPKKGNKDFIRSWLKQDCLLKYLEALSGRTAGQDGIQMDKLKAYPFPYPPIELQDQWVKIDKQIDKSKLILQKQLEDLVGETK